MFSKWREMLTKTSNSNTYFKEDISNPNMRLTEQEEKVDELVRLKFVTPERKGMNHA